jgi:hypothetical protein
MINFIQNYPNIPSAGLDTVTFTLPKNLPSGQYLVRAESIALHLASTYGGSTF